MRDFDHSDKFTDIRGITPRNIHRRENFSQDRGDLVLERTSYYIRSHSNSFKTEEEYVGTTIKEEVIGYAEVTKGISIESPDSFSGMINNLLSLMDRNLIRRLVIFDDRLREDEVMVMDKFYHEGEVDRDGMD